MELKNCEKENKSMETIESCHDKIMHGLIVASQFDRDGVDFLKEDYFIEVLSKTSDQRVPANYYRELERMNILVRLNYILASNGAPPVAIRKMPRAKLLDYCSNCKIPLNVTESELVCPRCNIVEDNLTTIVMPSGGGEDRKHYYTQMDSLFGRMNKSIPTAILEKIRKYVITHRIDIRNSANYAYKMRKILNRLRIRKMNNMTTILIKLIWNLDIPTLDYSEEQRHKYIYTKLDDAQQIVFPNGYKINYSYMIYKVFQCGFDWDSSPKIREITRYIYIQDADTFKEHDKKFKQLVEYIKNNSEKASVPLIYRATPKNLYCS